jgi:hypothetical protein
VNEVPTESERSLQCVERLYLRIVDQSLAAEPYLHPIELLREGLVGVGHGASITGAEHIAGLGDFKQRLLEPILAAVGVFGLLAYELAPLLGGLGVLSGYSVIFLQAF